MKKTASKTNSQKQKFIAAARAADCDESETTFGGKLKRIAMAKLSRNEDSENGRKKSSDKP